jgi:hypothetical protein
MIDLKQISLFLGIRVIRSENEITLDQTIFLKNILTKFNMSDCKLVATPFPVQINYEELNISYNAPCKNLFGCLMYAMLCTRPDLCAAVNILSRFQSKNNKELWQCLKRVLRYIKGTLDIKLVNKRFTYTNVFIGYADADWGNDLSDRKSTTGYLFCVFESCTICWNTKKQNSVATSSAEAEYMALYESVKEAMWLKSLMKSIDFEIKDPIIIFEDNNGCISIANNPTDHKRTKHIDIKYHFIREQIQQNTII